MMPPSSHMSMRKDDKDHSVAENVHLLDEFCRKRSEPVDLNQSAVGLNIKRVKTVDTQIPSVGGQDNGMNVRRWVRIAKYYRLLCFSIQRRAKGGNGGIPGCRRNQPSVTHLL